MKSPRFIVVYPPPSFLHRALSIPDGPSNTKPEKGYTLSPGVIFLLGMVEKIVGGSGGRGINLSLILTGHALSVEGNGRALDIPNSLLSTHSAY